MLSYRHSFHAGNFADLLKHIVLVEILKYMGSKDKVFEYIDTHAGAGLYNLNDEHAKKLGEYQNGIGRLKPEAWPELEDYFDIIAECNPNHTLDFYPGSPYFARALLREYDHAHLFELHPQDIEHLRQNLGGTRQVKIKQEDGFKGLIALLPPKSRRGLVLIDPPYEIKTDYDQVVRTLEQAHRRFATGCYAIWYPVVQRPQIERMLSKIKQSGIRNIQVFELALQEDTEARGMTASGMVVVNPPWTLATKMAELLPKLAKAINGPLSGVRCETLVEE